MSKNVKREGQKSFCLDFIYKYINSLCGLQIFSYIPYMKFVESNCLYDPSFEIIKVKPDGGGGHNLRGITHYTLIPSKIMDDGWEDVIYLKQRYFRDNLTLSKNGNGGFVYILSNEGWPGILKIGFTTSQVEKRVSEINNAGSLVDWQVEYSFKCGRPYDLEQALHRHLEFCRSRSNREFFEIELQNAISLIKNFGKYYSPID